MPDQPSIDSFAARFREVIRIGLNWDRFFAEKWPIEVVMLDSPEDLGRCFMPWYIGKKGDEVAYDFPGAAPLKLTDVPKSVDILNLERQSDIHEVVAEFGREKETIEFTVPTYGLPNDQYFVLDGNHRLSALTLISVPFKVTLWNVGGPLDPDCLLDLVHWQSKTAGS